MKIGIIVYSYTNNTLRIAQKLESSLVNRGYDVELKSIKAQNENPNATSYHLVNVPSTEKYDAIVFATCVRGFDCAPIFKEYIQSLNTLANKKIAGFVSQFFPFDAWGGNQSLNTMESLVSQKGTKLIKLGSIHTKFRNQEKQIMNLIDQCDHLLKT